MNYLKRHKLLVLSIVLSLTIHLASLGASIPGLSFPHSDKILTARLYSDRAAEPGISGPVMSSARKRIKQRETRTTIPPEESPALKGDRATGEPNSQQNKKDAAGKDEKITEEAESKTGTEITVNQQPPDLSGVLGNISERLDFDIYWMGVFVGRSQLEAVPDGKTLTIRSETRSAALLSTFYKVEDYIESRIVEGRAATFRIIQREGKYRSNKEVVFDSDNKTVTYTDHLKDLRKEHPMTAPALWDMISAFYYVRTQPLIVGQTVYLNVFDSNKFFNVEVNVLAKEKVSLSADLEVDTVKIRPVLKSDGIFQKKGDILIWLTDDEKRTPVRMETEVPVGSIVARLKDVGQPEGKATD